MIELQNKRFEFVNYEFRPDSYWNDESDPLTTILKDVKGTQRREMIKNFWDQGNFDLLDDTLLKDELDDNERESLGAVHPSFMGGEYLPEYLPLVTEIARIELQSTTADVTEMLEKIVETFQDREIVETFQDEKTELDKQERYSHRHGHEVAHRQVVGHGRSLLGRSSRQS